MISIVAAETAPSASQNARFDITSSAAGRTDGRLKLDKMQDFYRQAQIYGK